MWNLVDDAFAFTTPGGHVRVSVRSRGAVRRVEDTGLTVRTRA